MIIKYKRLAAIVLMTTLFLHGCERTVYPVNKDTVRTFGDGRFQIGKSTQGYSLHDCKTYGYVAAYIRDWTTKGDLIFTVDREGVCRVTNYRTGDGKEYESIEISPSEFRPIFQKLQ